MVFSCEDAAPIGRLLMEYLCKLPMALHEKREIGSYAI
jgi:hypothetical protein